MANLEDLSRAMNPQAAAAPAGGGMDFHAILAALMQQQQQQPNLAILGQILNAPRGHHYGIGGGEITDQNQVGNVGGDPFTNGFFNHQAPANPNMVLGGSTPQQIAAFNPQTLVAPPSPPIPHLIFGQGMINPQLADASKYQDSNFWAASPQINPNGWLPGASVRDESKQYGTPPNPNIASVPRRPIPNRRPAFSF